MSLYDKMEKRNFVLNVAHGNNDEKLMLILLFFLLQEIAKYRGSTTSAKIPLEDNLLMFAQVGDHLQSLLHKFCITQFFSGPKIRVMLGPPVKSIHE